MKPLISVVVPVYNVQSYVSKCIESILQQTHDNLEIILIDDGSEDESPLICDKYAKEHDNIVVLHQRNSGPSKARNSGLDIANGEYIAFVDSDDYIHPIYIEFLLAQMMLSNVRISCCGYTRDAKQLHDGELSIDSYGVTLNDTEAFGKLLDNQEFCAPWGKLYNRDVINHIRFPEGLLFEDMVFAPQVFKLAKFIAVSDINLYYYNQENVSIVRSLLNYSKLLQYINGVEYWVIFAKSNYPSLIEKSTVVFNRNIINICKVIASEEAVEFKLLHDNLRNDILRNTRSILYTKEYSFKYKVKFLLIKYGIY